MNKLIFGALAVFIFILVVVPALAEESSTSAGNVAPSLKERLLNKIQRIEIRTDKKIDKIEANTEKRVERIENRIEGSTSAKVKVVERVRNSVGVRWNVFNKAVEKTVVLLDKLQARIDSAKGAGKDTKEAEGSIVDARAKLDNIKTKLTEIESLKGTAVDKTTFLEIQGKFKEIQRDLHIIRVDASKIIRILKGFNSATSSGKNPQATTSAKDSD